MTHKKVRAVAYGMTALMAVSGMNLQVEAAKLSEVLPSAGISLTLSDGTSLAMIQEKVLASAKEDRNLKLSVSELKTFLEENKAVSRKTAVSASIIKQAEVQEVLAAVEAEKEAMEQEDVQVSAGTVLAEVASGNAEGVLSSTGSGTQAEEDKPVTAEAQTNQNTQTVSSDEAASDEKSEDASASTDEKAAAENTDKENDTVSGNDTAEISREEKDTDDSTEGTDIEVTRSTVEVVAGKMASLTEEERGFTNLVIAQVDNYVNVRSDASEESEILGKLYDKSVGEFISEKDGWYEITSGNVTGYVKAEYCVTGRDAVDLAKEIGTRMATVTTTTLRVREEASTEAKVLGIVPIEEDLTVVEEQDGWVKVDIEEGYGWVSTDYVSLRTDFVKAESKEEEEARLAKEAEARRKAKAEASANSKKVESNDSKKSYNSASSYIPAGGGSASGNAVAQFALQFKGNPYVYGGSSLTNGTDCSGFVMSVYKNFGVSLPHSSKADRSVGSGVGSLAEAQPGDIICYSGHVGLYIGDGQIVHASTARTGIIVSNASYRNILAIRRIF